MKLKIFLLLCFSFFTSLISSEEVWDVSVSSLSGIKFASFAKNHSLNISDNDYYKTLVKFLKYPNENDFILKCDRPLLGKHYIRKISVDSLLQTGRNFGENCPVLVISGRGFLPGEEVYITLEDSKRSFASSKLTFCPQPIIRSMREGISKIKARLTILDPARYEIYFEGIKNFEKLKTRSISSGELLENEFVYCKEVCIGLTPAVLGKAGGFCDFCITRQKGDTYNIIVPWGTELFKFFEDKIQFIE